MDIIQNLVESTIEPLLDQLEFADSEMEREVALEEIDSVRISFGEAQSATEEVELNYLVDYMSQSYKSDFDLIDRYLELTGQGPYSRSYRGGGGGGGSSTPSPPVNKEIEDIIEEIEEDYDYEEWSFWDELLEFEEIVQSFFENFF